MLIVRSVNNSDLDGVVNLESITFTDAWTARSVKETYEHTQAFVAVAELDEKVVGYCIVYFVLDEGEIARIAVDKCCRRQGVGRQLLKYVESICDKKCIDRLLLDVRESNEGARDFYKSLGFKEDGVRKNFYEKPKENAVLMSKFLR